MKENGALVGSGIDKGKSGGLTVGNTLNAWNISTTCSFHEQENATSEAKCLESEPGIWCNLRNRAALSPLNHRGV